MSRSQFLSNLLISALALALATPALAINTNCERGPGDVTYFSEQTMANRADNRFMPVLRVAAFSHAGEERWQTVVLHDGLSNKTRDHGLLLTDAALYVGFNFGSGGAWMLQALDPQTGDLLWPGPARIMEVPGGATPDDVFLAPGKDGYVFAVLASTADKARTCRAVQFRIRGPADIAPPEEIEVFSCPGQVAMGRTESEVLIGAGTTLRRYSFETEAEVTRSVVHLEGVGPDAGTWASPKIAVRPDGSAAAVFVRGTGWLAGTIDDRGIAPESVHTLPEFQMGSGYRSGLDFRFAEGGRIHVLTPNVEHIVGPGGVEASGNPRDPAYEFAVECPCFTPDGGHLQLRPAGKSPMVAAYRPPTALSPLAVDFDGDGIGGADDRCPVHAANDTGADDLSPLQAVMGTGTGDGCPRWKSWTVGTGGEVLASWGGAVEVTAGSDDIRASAADTGPANTVVLVARGGRALVRCPLAGGECAEEIPVLGRAVDVAWRFGGSDDTIKSVQIRLDNGRMLHWWNEPYNRLTPGPVTKWGELYMGKSVSPACLGLYPGPGCRFSSKKFKEADRAFVSHVPEIPRPGVSSMEPRSGLTDSGKLFDFVGNWRDHPDECRAIATPEDAPVRGHGAVGDREVVQMVDGRVFYEGLAGGWFPVQGELPEDVATHGALEAFGDQEYGIVTLGPGLSFQLIRNSVEPLPADWAGARPLGVWRTSTDGLPTYSVVLSNEVGTFSVPVQLAE